MTYRLYAYLCLMGIVAVTYTYNIFLIFRFESSHPFHTRKSLSYSQFLHICRIGTHRSDFFLHALQVKSYFLDRGYPYDILEDVFVRTLTQDRHALPFPHPHLPTPPTPPPPHIARNHSSLLPLSIPLEQSSRIHSRKIGISWELLQLNNSTPPPSPLAKVG